MSHRAFAWPGKALRALAATLAFAPLVPLVANPAAPASSARPYSGTPVDVLTYHNDNARTGSNREETDLTVASVSSARFGPLRTIAVSGSVLAQPLMVSGFRMPDDSVHDVLVVATEMNDVYAIDGETYDTLWHVNLGNPQNSADVKCSRVDRLYGVSSTPVVARLGRGRATLYVVASTESADGDFRTVLHALDLSDGSDLHPPATVDAHVTLQDGSVVKYSSRLQFVRAGLAYHDGGIYFGATTRCEFDDKDKITGWIFRYDDRLKQTAAFSTITKGASKPPGLKLASLWAAGFAPAIDDDGSLVAVTGNGNFHDGGVDWGESVLRLDAGLGGVADYFTPAAYHQLNNDDLDFGGGGVLLIPVDHAQQAPPLAVAMGKAHVLYLLDRTKLGHVQDGDAGALQVQALDGEGIWGGPCYWRGPQGGRVYYQSRDDVMRAYAVDTGAHPALTEIAHGSEPARLSQPIVSSSGRTAGTGVVWTINNDHLLAYDAEALGAPIFDARVPPWSFGSAFQTPLQANGRVYVGSTGAVAVFGLSD
jgi:outer membrane protein assembly factor BamB